MRNHSPERAAADRMQRVELVKESEGQCGVLLVEVVSDRCVHRGKTKSSSAETLPRRSSYPRVKGSVQFPPAAKRVSCNLDRRAIGLERSCTRGGLPEGPVKSGGAWLRSGPLGLAPYERRSGIEVQ